MPNGGHVDPEVDNGEVCAGCHKRFRGAHKQPVLCPVCYKYEEDKGRKPIMAKAWLEVEVE